MTTQRSRTLTKSQSSPELRIPSRTEHKSTREKDHNVEFKTHTSILKNNKNISFQLDPKIVFNAVVNAATEAALDKIDEKIRNGEDMTTVITQQAKISAKFTHVFFKAFAEEKAGVRLQQNRGIEFRHTALKKRAI